MFGLTADSGCNDWKTIENTFSWGGIYYPQYNTNASCQHACLAVLAGCVAVDISVDGVECWVHFNASDLTANVTWAGVNQYRIVTRPCASNGDNMNCIGRNLMLKQCKFAVSTKWLTAGRELPFLNLYLLMFVLRATCNISSHATDCSSPALFRPPVAPCQPVK